MKCKYNKTCEKYNDVSVTCNKNGGMYYQDLNIGCGCYRKLEKEDGRS